MLWIIFERSERRGIGIFDRINMIFKILRILPEPATSVSIRES